MASEPGTQPGTTDGAASAPRGEGAAPLRAAVLREGAGVRRAGRLAAWGRPAASLRFATGARAEALARLGVVRVRDELYAVPHRYLDFTQVTSVLEARVGEEVTCVVTVDEVRVKHPKPRMTLVEVMAYDDTAPLVVTYFGQPWMARQIQAGQVVAFSGKVAFSYGYKRMSGAFHVVVSDATREAQVSADPRARVSSAARVLPVHRLTEGLSASWARRIAACAVADYAGVADFWDARTRARLALMPLSRTLACAHFPRSLDEAEEARRRLAFDEAALLQVALVTTRDARLPGVTPTAHVVDGPASRALAAAMPFALTEDQTAAVADILADMAADRPMSRLLLGDVGTGKTAVATRALAAVADTHAQAAVMAPTGVLARQYAEKVGPVLDAAHISWALLTGATPARERSRILEALGAGETCVLFGTHALLTSDVVFRRLSLVVIDEQQRFGVAQRHALREKGRGADLLVMTATPIPRTLALTLYGDLDRSYLRQRPVPGAGVTTRVIAKRDRADAYEAMRQALAAGRQAYVVCPLVGTKADGDAEADAAAEALAAGEDPSDARAATREAEVLARSVFPEARVGLLTGRMKPQEKAEVMDAFRSGATQVLVSTTVIEVGVDVPNATVMLIEDGERFGLAQLHQLRGRVGRGSHPGTVFIAASTSSKAARERLGALEATSDGFELAEYDLRLRREGDVLGSKQSGDAHLAFVDLARDADLLEAAHALVGDMLADDPNLERPEHRPVRDEVVIRYGDVFREVSGG